MDKTETAKIMVILRAAYPGYYRNTSAADAKTAVNLWHMMLGHHPFRLVEAAVHSHIATNKWPPTMAEINAEIARLTQPDEITEMEAWNLVTKALSNSGYEAKAEFDALPETIQRVLGSPATLREWAVLPVKEVQTVVASNFQRSYRAKVEADRKYSVLPATVKDMMATSAIKSLPGEGGVG